MNTKTKKITVIAMLSAAAGILMLMEFPIPIFPSFLEIDFSDLPALLGSFLISPVAGVVIVFLKIVINLLFTGTATGFIGEAANFVIGVSFVIPAGLIYQNNKTKRGAVTGMLFGILSMAVIGGFANYFVLIPLFIKGMPANELSKLVIYSIIPFNILKGTMSSILAFLLYKRLSHFFNR